MPAQHSSRWDNYHPPIHSSLLPSWCVGWNLQGPSTPTNESPLSVRTMYMFICFSTHAVHLERAVNLSTATFLAALSRFANRRGSPKHIYSDHGRNFVGAVRELKEAYEVLESESFQNTAYHFARVHHLKWHFISQRAPHFGGLCAHFSPLHY